MWGYSHNQFNNLLNTETSSVFKVFGNPIIYAVARRKRQIGNEPPFAGSTFRDYANMVDMSSEKGLVSKSPATDIKLIPSFK